ncbi:MAG: WYL domain-containing protein [Kineosporiaceae bacterium]
MSSRRTERLLNLVICLLATRRWLSKEQIRSAVPQYADCASTEAFDRMFERDKEDLRELGIPVSTGSDSAWFDDEPGYRIDPHAYALPPIDLTAEESAVLGLAARVWQQAGLAGPAAAGLAKLRAAGVDLDEESVAGVEPHVLTPEPAFDPLYAATRDRAPVGFGYRKPEGDAGARRVQPWALTSRGGHWYLVGHDLDRGAPRAFRLSRIQGDVRRLGPAGSFEPPADLDPASLVGAGPRRNDPRVALLHVRAGRGGFLRRRAVPVEPAAAGVDAAPATAGPNAGWDEVRVPVADPHGLAVEVVGHGPDVRLLWPPDVAALVATHLRAVARSHGLADPAAEVAS